MVGRTFRDDPAAGLKFVAADLSSTSEAVSVGRELPAESFDVVLFNTGIIAAKTREETTEHLERDVAISYLSRLAVLQGLSPRLGSARADSAPRPRVFVMGSPGTGTIGNLDDLNSEDAYRSMAAHDNTIAGNEILGLGAKDRVPGSGVLRLGPRAHQDRHPKQLVGRRQHHSQTCRVRRRHPGAICSDLRKAGGAAAFRAGTRR